MFNNNSNKSVLPTTHPVSISVRPKLRPMHSTIPTRSPLTAAATYLSRTWQWLRGTRWVYIVSLHDFASHTPQHTTIGCFTTQAEADAARDKAIDGRRSTGKKIWRRYEEIEDGAHGTLVEDRDVGRCDVMALMERVRLG